MSLIEFIYHDFFLQKIYPEGLSEFVRIGQFGLQDAGTFSMSIHTKQRPAMEIAKWGVYGRSYDVIVINLLGSGAKDINISNWINTGFAFFDFSREGEDLRIHARESEWAFDITVASLSFQSCSTYIE